MNRLAVLAVAGACITGLVGCTDANDDSEPDNSELEATAADQYPDVIDAIATFDDASQTWTFDVTMSSPYDTPERFADGWRVIGLDGTVYGTHTLAHDHAGEQPFTRRQSNLEIPDGVDEVIIEGRDQINGFGGRTVTIILQTG